MTHKEQARLQVLNSLLAEHMTLDQGMLVQMDGSHHPWLGNRVPPFTLLIAVDDATGTVVDALFCEQEDALSRVKHSCRSGVNQFCRFTSLS